MSGVLEKLIVPLGLDPKEFLSGLDEMKSKASSTFRGISDIGGGIFAGLVGMGVTAVAGLGAVLIDSTKGAMEAQQIQAQLGAVIESTGGKAGVTADMVNDLATSLSKVTPVEDDLIVSAQNMLLTFTGIGKDVFPDVTKMTLDMATAMNGGATPSAEQLSSTAMMLGKALNDPSQGLSALTRNGVTFTEEQKKMIEEMVKTGDVAGAQKLMLAELSTEFGGSAEAAGKTFAGQLQILQNKLGGVKDTIGAKVLPLLGDLTTRFSNWIDLPSTQSMIDGFIGGIETLVDKTIEFIPVALQKFEDMKNWFVNNKPIVFGILYALGIALLAFGITSAIAAITALTPWLPVIAVLALIGVSAALFYQVWTTNMFGIQEKTASVINAVKGFFTSLWQGIQNGWNAFKNFFYPTYLAFTAAFKGDWYTFGQALRTQWDAIVLALKTAASNLWNNLKDSFNTAKDGIINTFKNTDWGAVGKSLMEGVARGISNGAKLIKDAAMKAAKAAYEAVKGFFGIHSPSTLMADKIGLPMAQGMEKGFTRGSNAFVNRMPDTFRKVESTQINNTTQVTNNSMDYKKLGRTIRDAMLQGA